MVVGSGAGVVVVTLGAAGWGAPAAPDVTVVRTEGATSDAPAEGGDVVVDVVVDVAAFVAGVDGTAAPPAA